MKVAVVGCGYVGLVSGVGLAGLGHSVVGIDADEARVAQLQAGEVPFHEPGLQQALASAIAAERFSVTRSLDDAARADVVLLCVQTPPSASGEIELGFLTAAVDRLGAVLRDSRRRTVVAVRSTVPPGTLDTIVAGALERPGTIGVASNPEFLREGSALDDFVHADRVVAGVREDWVAETMTTLYAPLGAPVVISTPATAELAKYASNALLATAISFANELAHVAEATPGVDVEDVLEIVHRDRRLTMRTENGVVQAPFVSYLKAGCGFGGSCLPKDLNGLIAFAKSVSEPTPLLEAVASVNRAQAGRLVDLAERRLGTLEGRRVAVLGAAFKAGTDDLRGSPALRVVDELLERRATVLVYDPLVGRRRLESALPAGASGVETLADAVAQAEACLVTTNDPEFQVLAELAARRDGEGPLVVDGRRDLSAGGFPKSRYVAIGKADT